MRCLLFIVAITIITSVCIFSSLFIYSFFKHLKKYCRSSELTIQELRVGSARAVSDVQEGIKNMGSGGGRGRRVMRRTSIRQAVDRGEGLAKVLGSGGGNDYNKMRTMASYLGFP